MLSDGFHNYAYNADGMLTSVDSGAATYQYSSGGERIRKNTAAGSTEYVYFGGNAIAERNVSTGGWTNYIFFNGKRLVRRDPSGAVHYYLGDHLGSTSIVVSASGAIENESEFYPFGGELQFSAADSANHYKFTGKERDSESGLDYFGARYNASSMGRFMTPDSPSYSNSKNPQSWNLYAYSLNNPVSFRDADGHEVVCANNPEQCKKDAAAATANAEAAKRVTTNTETTKHSFLGIKWTTTKTTIGITGDIKSFRALSANASKLADLVTDSRTVTVSYDNLARQSSWDTGLPLNGGSTSYMNPFLAIIDPTRTAGAVYDPDAVAQHIPQANTAEEFGHEVLGHIWGDMFGGAPAGTRANMRDSIVGEDAVRALDPTRGQKGIESHHNYNEMPPDNYKPPKQ
jgi:RHS repeat-associated protein